MAICVSVAIDNIVLKIDKLYDYSVPDELVDFIVPGVRVVVPFSNANIRKKAIVISKFEKDDICRLKSVLAVADIEPVVNWLQLELLDILKTKYFVPYYKAFRAIVPRGVDFKINEKYIACEQLQDKSTDLYEFIKSKKNGVKFDEIPHNLVSQFKNELACGNIISELSVSVKGDRTERYLILKIDQDTVEQHISKISKHHERQHDLLCLFLDYNEISFRDAAYYTGCTMSTVNSLVKKGIIEVVEKKIENNPYKQLEKSVDHTPITLSSDQQKVHDNIMSLFGEFNTHLIHGVTGSGKTLVYMSLIDSVIKNGKSVIFMVPEISLTPQTLSRFYLRYGDNVAVIHSGLSPIERAGEWRKIKAGDSMVIVGTRSSVFSPVNNLGLIIIDEEHEPSYKSESSPRYHARDIAKYICRRLDIPLVLGSATPSIESFYYSKKGAYKYHRLDKRFNNSPLPSANIIDMTDAYKQGDQSFLSEQLKEEIELNLKNSEQTILFLNRRGANPLVGCRSCGYVAKCPNCDISLTYHLANGRCMCHYCGYSIKFFEQCPQCSGKHIKKLGIGTQLVYSELRNIFPSASVLRMDFDTVGSYIEYGDKLTDFKNGKYDIMLGTQMVAKGLDFPNVTLVGVINADLSLHVDDFRAAERTFSLLTQVCGRSGRAGKAGRAIIQTYSPDNKIIKFAKTQNYDEYFKHEISFRKALCYPPYCDIVLFTVSSKDNNIAYGDVKKLYNKLNDLSKTKYYDLPVRLMAPIAPKIARFNDKYRYNLMVKTKNSKKLCALLDEINLFFTNDLQSDLVININPMSNV